MTYQDRCKAIGGLHKELPCCVYHYFRSKAQPPYAIWQEDGGENFSADNRCAEYSVTGTTDYFTRTEYDPVVDQIQAMFARAGFAWELKSIQYEESTGLIHYEWRWEV